MDILNCRYKDTTEIRKLKNGKYLNICIRSDGTTKTNAETIIILAITAKFFLVIRHPNLNASLIENMVILLFYLKWLTDAKATALSPNMVYTQFPWYNIALLWWN